MKQRSPRGATPIRNPKSEIQNRKGRFIVLDGPDGAGKTTQAKLLAERLKALGVEVVLLREPGGTATGEAVRKILLEHRKQDRLSPLAETFLFQAARAQLIQEVIRPALASGNWVLCDRFTLSTLVYQGIAGGIDRRIVEKLSGVATGGLWPDRYLVLWVPLDVSNAWRSNRAADRMEGKGAEFMRAVTDAFRCEAKRSPRKFRFVDGRGSPDEVHARIWRAVEGLLK